MKDPEMEQIKAERLYDLARLMRVEIQPPTTKTPEAIAPQTVPQALPQSPQTVIQATASQVDNPALWQQEDDAARLQTLSQVKAPSFPPPQSPSAVAADAPLPAPRKRPKSLKRRWYELTQSSNRHTDKGLYVVVFLVGLLARSTASSMLPGWGIRVVDWGSLGFLLVTAGFCFLEREFYLAAALALGVLLAKRFL